MGWNFTEFFVKVAPVSMPVLAVGLLTCFLITMSLTGLLASYYLL